LNEKVINQFFAHILTLSPGNLAEFNHRVEEPELRNFRGTLYRFPKAWNM